MNTKEFNQELVVKPTRIILYYLMVPIFGPTGGALAYLVGSVAQLVLSVIVGNKHSLVMEYRKYVILTAIPTLINRICHVAS
jgi:O-antigen/teichoic acid export membrane protein